MKPEKDRQLEQERMSKSQQQKEARERRERSQTEKEQQQKHQEYLQRQVDYYLFLIISCHLINLFFII